MIIKLNINCKYIKIKYIYNVREYVLWSMTILQPHDKSVGGSDRHVSWLMLSILIPMLCMLIIMLTLIIVQIWMLNREQMIYHLEYVTYCVIIPMIYMKLYKFNMLKKYGNILQHDLISCYTYVVD
jgi:hypothetical protein